MYIYEMNSTAFKLNHNRNYLSLKRIVSVRHQEKKELTIVIFNKNTRREIL